MANTTHIEWTDSTWNPVTGCTKISAGCDNCYAERFAERFRGVKGHPYEQGFDLQLREERIAQPLQWKQPRRIFVNSMSDLFHKFVPKEFVNRVFQTMEEADRHTFQILTKRSSRMRDYVKSRYIGTSAPSNIWFGTSVEDVTKLSRLNHIRAIAAETKFLSIEPLIGRIGQIDLKGIHWVIVGGESGPKARPMEADWVREIRDQCMEARVAFFFKQWGGRIPKENGREIDGREWNGFPDMYDFGRSQNLISVAAE